MTPPLGPVTAIVRGWTRLYTWRTPPYLRDTRRAEIESDLWEFAHDSDRSDGIGATLHILARLMLGVPDDLAWRAAHVSAGSKPGRRTVLVTASAVALILAVLWVYEQIRPRQLPAPPSMMKFVAAPPPPPVPYPLVAFVTLYRDDVNVLEILPVAVTTGVEGRSTAVPFRFSVPLDDVSPGAYDCQVTVLDPAGRKAAFWRAPVLLVP